MQTLKLHKIKFLLFIIAVLISVIGYLLFSQNNNELRTLFPIQNYDQHISNWIKPTDADYDKPLLTPAQQKARKEELYQRYFGEKSPWSSEYINKVYSQPVPDDLISAEQEKINTFNNKNKPDNEIGYGPHFRPYDEQWINNIINNMNLSQLKNRHYESARRGITIDNLQARVLPTDDVFFYNHKLAGEGYPFDNMQATTIWAGTPIYILGKTMDQSWTFVLTPSFAAWVKSTGIATVDNIFVKQWQQKAQIKLAAITDTKFSIIDSETGTYRFTGYIGMLLPAEKNKDGFRVFIPVVDLDRHAKIHHAELTKTQAVFFPLLPTPHHFADIFSHLIQRPYGWGGMYFNNDCASELKNIFTVFGIYIPIHSSNQVDPERFIVKNIDLSNATMDERLAYLEKNGHKFMTTVYIGGHVFLYLGKYTNPKDHSSVILTYQNMWGLRPKNINSRSIIGGAVLFPLQKSYPENPQLVSLADKSKFILGYLDQPVDEMRQPSKINIRADVSP